MLFRANNRQETVAKKQQQQSCDYFIIYLFINNINKKKQMQMFRWFDDLCHNRLEPDAPLLSWVWIKVDSTSFSMRFLDYNFSKREKKLFKKNVKIRIESKAVYLYVLVKRYNTFINQSIINVFCLFVILINFNASEKGRVIFIYSHFLYQYESFSFFSLFFILFSINISCCLGTFR